LICFVSRGIDHEGEEYVLYSKQQNADQIQSDVTKLVREMEISIKEANTFIEQMQSSK